MLDHIHGYSARGVYRLFTTSDEPVITNLDVDVWHKYIPSKIYVFAWRLLQNKLPTKNNMSRRNIIPSTELACSADCGISETDHQIFIECGLADSVWLLWKERNHRIFKNLASDPRVRIDKVKLNSFLWLKTNQVLFNYSYYDWWKHPLLCMGVCM